MICNTIRSMTSEYLDDRVVNEDRAEIENHLVHCEGCVEHFGVRRRLRANLKRLPARVPPARLETALRAVAHTERARAAENTGFPWRDRLDLTFRNLMRPFAVPAMGGIVSAIVLFSAIMPSIAIRVRPMLNDVPTNLSTDASAQFVAPIGLSERELVLDLVVDSEGRTVAYTVVSGSELLQDSTLKRQIDNNLFFAAFKPATLLGRPTSGRVRLKLTSDQNHDHISIRG
jgi:hypothetical protein